MSIARAKILRSRMTEAENFFWSHVRGRRLQGYKFRRQLPIGNYIADFVCLECKLTVEIDGGQHNENKRDAERDAFIGKAGFDVVRYWNNDVLNNIEGVLSTLTLTLSQRERELKERVHA